MPCAGWRRWVGTLGIVLMTLGNLHLPMPVADFHAVRHAHGAGEVCEQHNHLLRWHAGDSPSDRAVLHFHWVLIGADLPVAEAQGPTLHSDALKMFEAETAQGVPAPIIESRDRPESFAIFTPSFGIAAEDLGGIGARSTKWRSWSTSFPNFGTTYPPRISSSSRLQRWMC